MFIVKRPLLRRALLAGGRARGTVSLALAAPAVAATVFASVILLGAAPGQAARAGLGALAREGGSQVASGVISTVAGGPGGPGDATNVALKPCGVTFSKLGVLYISDGGGVHYGGNTAPTAGATATGAVREMSPSSNLLTPVAGTYALAAHPPGDGGPAIDATTGPCEVAGDGSGNLVIADPATCRVRVVAARTGWFYRRKMTAGDIYTVAGHGACRFSGDGGPALRAGVDPAAVQVDAGNLVIADVHNRIRVVAKRTRTFFGVAMTAGHIYTIAGTGTAGFSGDGGPAAKAALNKPSNVSLDAAGNLLIADNGNCRVRVVAAKTGAFYGQAMTANHIYTVAGDGSCAFAGNRVAAVSAGIAPEDAVADPAGNLVIADYHDRIRVVAATTGTFYGQDMIAGDIYTIAGSGAHGYSGDGGPALSAALSNPGGVAIANGNVVIADTHNFRVRVVAESTGTFYGVPMTTGDIYTIAGNGNLAFSGDGGPAAAAEFHDPGDLVVSQDGNLFLVDYFTNRVRMVPAASGTFFGQAMTAGDIYTIAGSGYDGYTGDGGPAVDAGLNDPAGIAVDAAGNLVIADTEDCQVRVVAASTGTFYGQDMTLGDIYTVAGNGHKTACVFPGGGEPATTAGTHPVGVAVDPRGNVLIADDLNCQVLVVAASTGTFYGQDMTVGYIYSVAGDGVCAFSGDGGAATGAGLDPAHVAVDAAGNLVIPDPANERVRVVAAATSKSYGIQMTDGDIYTIAGDGQQGFSGDGGPATSAMMDGPSTVAIDADGNVAIADSLNDRVRVVAAATGAYYGQAMTAGDIYTIAGNGTVSFSGDGGPATSAEMSGPVGLAVDAAGDLLISDGAGNNRIRAVGG